MKVRVAFVIGDYPPEERKRREDVALSYSSAEVEVGIVSAGVMPYIQGVKPTEIQLAAPYFIQAFRQAEKEGQDVLGHRLIEHAAAVGQHHIALDELGEDRPLDAHTGGMDPAQMPGRRPRCSQHRRPIIPVEDGVGRREGRPQCGLVVGEVVCRPGRGLRQPRWGRRLRRAEHQDTHHRR